MAERGKSGIQTFCRLPDHTEWACSDASPLIGTTHHIVRGLEVVCPISVPCYSRSFTTTAAPRRKAPARTHAPGPHRTGNDGNSAPENSYLSFSRSPSNPFI